MIKLQNTEFDIFINILMKNGKREKSAKIFFEILDILKNTFKYKFPYLAFLSAINNVSPKLRLLKFPKKNRRKFYFIPTIIYKQKAISLGIRWLLFYSRLRKEKTFSMKIASEFHDANLFQGNTFKRYLRYNNLLLESKRNLKKRRNKKS